MTVHEAGQLIARFVYGSPAYPQEWNDFIETRQRQPDTERYRLRCSELDPKINWPGPWDESARVEVLSLIALARKETYLQVAQTLENFVDGKGGAWDWDDYTSAMSFAGDPYLEEIQSRVDGLSSEFPSGSRTVYTGPGGVQVIRGYVEILRGRAAEFDRSPGLGD